MQTLGTRIYILSQHGMMYSSSNWWWCVYADRSRDTHDVKSNNFYLAAAATFFQQLQLTLDGCALSNLVPPLLFSRLGSESRLSDILSQMMSTRRSNTACGEKHVDFSYTFFEIYDNAECRRERLFRTCVAWYQFLPLHLFYSLWRWCFPLLTSRRTPVRASRPAAFPARRRWRARPPCRTCCPPGWPARCPRSTSWSGCT